MTDQAHGLRQMVLVDDDDGRVSEPDVNLPQGSARFIAVTSGKGGVGKTNLTVNLGIALARSGVRTAVFDADLGLGNIDIVLGEAPEYNLTHVLTGEKEIDEVIFEGPDNLRVLGSDSGLYEMANLSQRDLTRFVQKLEYLDHILDYVLIDTGAGISRGVLTFILSVNEVIIVVTPEPTSIADSYGMIKIIFSKNPDSLIYIVPNMVSSEEEAKEVYRRLMTVSRRFLGANLRYLGYMPRETVVSMAVKQQEPFLLSYPFSNVAKSVYAMAENLSGVSVEKKQKTGINGIFCRMAALIKGWMR